MKKPAQFEVWNVKVPKELDAALEKTAQTGQTVSKSEFIRDAVRKGLREKGAIE
jgi:Arc/MetJ-type ribon-helix-helix transcriptional regulator